MWPFAVGTVGTYYSSASSVACNMMECCCVDDMSAEHVVPGLSPGCE